ncbi:polyprotein [Plakobranchus ocellatus]|uniref:Polyprotein n=1 Tax=Plakobranchus ocellatus TaxID=259542 RepID=A0AAV4ACG9_9GAST|nr:polyprotein [Plakobranchus ocellatus]
MSGRSRRQSEKSNTSKMDESTKSIGNNAGLTEMEYFWSIELNADKRSYTWMNNDDMEDGDEDFIEYTLFLKAALLGANAVPNEYNILMLESPGSDGEPQKGGIANLCLGQNNMTILDITVSGRVGPTTFTLAEGSGPIFISGNQLMEFPKDDSVLDNSQTESEEEETEEEDIEMENGKENGKEVKKSESDIKKASKRKAGPIAGKPKQRAKIDKDEDEDDVEDEDENEEEEEEEEEEEASDEDDSEEEVK